MMLHGTCPICSQPIPRERLSEGTVVCPCGWTDPSMTYKAEDAMEKKNIITLIVAALILAGGYAHLVNWGSYATSIPFTKVAQLTGMLSKEGYQNLAQACIELNKWNCAKDAFLDLYRSKKDVEGLSGLAYLQTRLLETDAASATFASYFKVGGKDGLSALRYAKLLEEKGQIDEALKYYELSVTARPLDLPVQATTAIVRLLMKQGRYEDALARITEFHESAGNAKGYLNTELAQLEQFFAAQPKKSKQKKA